METKGTKAIRKIRGLLGLGPFEVYFLRVHTGGWDDIFFVKPENRSIKKICFTMSISQIHQEGLNYMPFLMKRLHEETLKEYSFPPKTELIFKEWKESDDMEKILCNWGNLV